VQSDAVLVAEWLPYANARDLSVWNTKQARLVFFPLCSKSRLRLCSSAAVVVMVSGFWQRCKNRAIDLSLGTIAGYSQ
jgi:hypothetical protein